MAIETGFCQRTSKLSPEIFFDIMFYVSSKTQNSSLENSVSYLESKYGIDIRKQSLDEKFTEKTVIFVKAVLSRLINSQFSEFLYREDFLHSNPRINRNNRIFRP